MPEDKEETATLGPGVLVGDPEATHKLPAVFSNRVYLMQKPGNLIRVAFGELDPGGRPQYHSAVMMTAMDALEIGYLLSQVALGKFPDQSEVQAYMDAALGVRRTEDGEVVPNGD